MRGTILIVDDDAASRSEVVAALKEAGFRAVSEPNVGRAMERLGRELPDVVITEVTLPGPSGLDLLERLRAQPETRHLPVMIVSERGNEVDRVTGLSLGADDYVVKPFSARELVLRVSALLRRSESSDAPNVLVCGPLRVDLSAHIVRLDGAEVTLTTREFTLLVDLVRHRGRVANRSALLARVCGRAEAMDSRAVDTLVTRLRRKLGRHGELIETVRSVGYRLRLPSR
jgi:two-component system phosphate regulon response regulator PhoB